MRYAYFVMCIAAAFLAGRSSTAAAASGAEEAEEAEEKLARMVTSELRASWSSIQEENANANSEFRDCESEAGKDKEAKKECRSARRETKRELFGRVDNLVVAAEENMERFIQGSQLRYHASIRASGRIDTMASVEVRRRAFESAKRWYMDNDEGYGPMLLSLCVAAEDSWEFLRGHPARGVTLNILNDGEFKLAEINRVCGEAREGIMSGQSFESD